MPGTWKQLKGIFFLQEFQPTLKNLDLRAESGGSNAGQRFTGSDGND